MQTINSHISTLADFTINITGYGYWVIVLNATFKNISATSWRSVRGENHRHITKLDHIMFVSSTININLAKMTRSNPKIGPF